MELREPPRTPPTSAPSRLPGWLLAAHLAALAGLGALVWLRTARVGPDPGAAETLRQVAAKLKAAGALDQAAALYGEYLTVSDEPAAARARIAFSLGTTYLEAGRPGEALRWFYEAETLGPGDLGEELDRKIVHTLERLGRVHAAQAALGARVRLAPAADEAVRRSAEDPVVARIGGEEIHRSEVERALDPLGPEAAQAWKNPELRQELLRRHVAEELLWRRAQKLEYDQDPEVRRQVAALARQVAVARFVEREVAARIAVDEADLRNFYAAHRDRYRPGEGQEPPPLERVRREVERDYRLSKLQAAYQQLVDSELAAQEVEIFPERMGDGR